MKKIEVENNHSCTVSVQAVETTIADHIGTRKGPDQVVLLIEDEEGDHLATFTAEQASTLIGAIYAAMETITNKSIQN